MFNVNYENGSIYHQEIINVPLTYPISSSLSSLTNDNNNKQTPLGKIANFFYI